MHHYNYFKPVLFEWCTWSLSPQDGACKFVTSFRCAMRMQGNLFGMRMDNICFPIPTSRTYTTAHVNADMSMCTYTHRSSPLAWVHVTLFASRRACACTDMTSTTPPHPPRQDCHGLLARLGGHPMLGRNTRTLGYTHILVFVRNMLDCDGSLTRAVTCILGSSSVCLVERNRCASANLALRPSMLDSNASCVPFVRVFVFCVCAQGGGRHCIMMFNKLN